MTTADQLSLFASAPPHRDTIPRVMHFPPLYPGEIDAWWPAVRPACPGCGTLMHLVTIRRIPGGYWGQFICSDCGGRGEGTTLAGQ